MEPDTQVVGLYRRSTRSGDKWVVSARVKGGNPTKVTIGYCSLFNTSQARTIAKQHLAAMAQGINPNDAQKAQSIKGKTLSEALNQYIHEKYRLLKPTTIQSYQGTINRNFKGWLNKPINAINSQDCVTRYNQIIVEVAKRSRSKQKANEPGEAEAHKAMRTLGAILGYFANDMLPGGSGKLLPNGNPVDGLKDKRIRHKLKSRTRALSFEERTDLLEFLTHPSNFLDKYGRPIKETRKTALKVDTTITTVPSTLLFELMLESMVQMTFQDMCILIKHMQLGFQRPQSDFEQKLFIESVAVEIACSKQCAAFDIV